MGKINSVSARPNTVLKTTFNLPVMEAMNDHRHLRAALVSKNDDFKRIVSTFRALNTTLLNC